MRDWASVAGRGRLLLSGSVAHASLKTAVNRLLLANGLRNRRRSILVTLCEKGSFCRMTVFLQKGLSISAETIYFSRKQSANCLLSEHFLWVLAVTISVVDLE